MRTFALLATVAACQSSASPEQESQRCATCHMTEFRNATAPMHVGSLPTPCGVCHAQTGWRPAILGHAWWPLAGGHAKAPCAACHAGNPPKFAGTKKECLACHRPEYDRGPEHVARKFSTTCQSCHTATSWSDMLEHPAEPTPPPPSARPVQPPRPKPSQVPPHPSSRK